MTLASPVAATVAALVQAAVDGLSGPAAEAVCDSAWVEAQPQTAAQVAQALAQRQRAEAPGLPRPTVAVPLLL